MARVHRLKHIEGFLAATLANYNAVWPHAQCILYQVALANFALAFGIGRPRFQPSNMQLLQLQFRGVLDRNQTFMVRNGVRESIEQVSFSRFPYRPR